MFEITVENMHHCFWYRRKNDDCYRKGRGGGGQGVMIEIIISVNDENDGRPLRIWNHFYGKVPISLIDS